MMAAQEASLSRVSGECTAVSRSEEEEGAGLGRPRKAVELLSSAESLKMSKNR